MCHVLWQWTTGDAVGPNMMTRNSYALNMGYVMQRAPVKPERAILEANMGGDKKPSAEYFQSGHGKTVLAEAFLSDEQIRRVLRTTAEDLEALSWAGTHGSVASGMQSVAFTPGLRDRRDLRRDRPGPRHGRDELDGARHRRAASRAGCRRSIRFGGLEVGTVGGGTTLPSARDWLASIGCAGAGQGLPLRADRRRGGALPRDQRVGRDGDRRQRELLQGAPRARRPAVIALVFRYEVRDPEAFEQVYGPEANGRSSSARARATSARSCCTTSSEPDRYLVIDRWESAEAYNAFLAEHQDEYLRRSDEARFHYLQELRFGTFENVWAE